MRRLQALALGALLATGSVLPTAAAAQSMRDTEAQIGAQVYAQLKQKGEIISRASDPSGYALLDPIAARIAQVADPQYDFPFHFILVNEAQPNAFAVPGGNVYVTNALLKFVQNKEELAGVLCHETSHDIHHDVINENAKAQRTGAIIGILGAITGLSNSGLGQIGESFAYGSFTNGFSRTVEANADQKGAITCAQAGFNPWGMVWLFQNFEKADTGGRMEFLSDHPSDQHRISLLENEFRSDPSLFGRFSSNIASATPLNAPSTAYKQQRRNRSGTSRSVARRPSNYCCAPRNNPAVSAARPRATPPPSDTTTILGQ
ncbi:MAG: M48 family metalloprotease [Candidatus Eremiobacteraeota bacterium]|nr:M48 family metalloprotease [Candidatus Eremiobacteraeota bacterium]MBC5802749.1 M48 family metalloprotease [Candidatus Eremiobacteraeota bacterium]